MNLETEVSRSQQKLLCRQFMKDQKLEVGYRIDLVVEGRVVVEVKSVESIHPIHEAQLLSYMRLSGIGIGLLINFNVLQLRNGVKRMVDGNNWMK